jgi:hypothetical protein
MLFDFMIENGDGYKTSIAIKKDCKDQIIQFLSASDPTEAPIENFYGVWYWLENI